MFQPYLFKSVSEYRHSSNEVKSEATTPLTYVPTNQEQTATIPWPTVGKLSLGVASITLIYTM